MVELVKEHATTWPLWLIIKHAADQLPQKGRVWVGKKPWPAREKGSRTVLRANPTTLPLFSGESDALTSTFGRVPRSVIVTSSQVTARFSGTRNKGSSCPFSEVPTISPLAVIQRALLLAPPGSTPRPVRTPFHD